MLCLVSASVSKVERAMDPRSLAMPDDRHIKLCQDWAHSTTSVSYEDTGALQYQAQVLVQASIAQSICSQGARIGSWLLLLLGMALFPLLPMCAAEAEAVSVDAVTSAAVLEEDPLRSTYDLHFSEDKLQERVQMLESISDEIRLDNTPHDALTAEDLLDSVQGTENDGLFLGRNANDVRQDTKQMAAAAAAQNTPLVDPVTGYDSANYHVFNPRPLPLLRRIPR